MKAEAASRGLPGDRRKPGISLDFEGLGTVQDKGKEKARKVVDLQDADISKKGKGSRRKEFCLREFCLRESCLRVREVVLVILRMGFKFNTLVDLFRWRM